MPFLEAENVSKHFGGVAALSDVSFHVDKGEIVGLIGPNGAGKTTLFNVICCVYRPNSGIIKFDGSKITGLKPHDICRGGIARTFQITKSFGNLSVLENIMIGSLFGKESHGSLKIAGEEARQLIEFTGLIGKGDMPAGSLISADARRLELARALAAKPEILLLDEVMAGLNPSEVGEAMTLIQRLRNEMRITIFMVEHIMKSVMGVSDRIIVLESGRKIAEGTPKEVSENPAVIEAYLGKVEEA
jgi:branched-chain amino acid transport system ATP-binding protein